MTSHRLGRADEGTLTLEQAVEGHGLVHVALMGRGGVGIDIVDILGLDASILHGARHGHIAALVAGLRDASTIAGEAIAADLGDNLGTTRYGMVVVFEHKGCSTTAGDESVAIAIEGA